MSDTRDTILTVAIGGAAGDGVREAGASLGTLLTDLGLYAHLSFKYPSLIRGGHNYSRISFSREKVFYDYNHLDVLIALNGDSVKRHIGHLNPDAIVFADAFQPDELATLGQNAVVLPLAEFAKSINASPITRSSVALGAFCYLLDLPLPKMVDVLHRIFQGKESDANIKLAEMGYECLQKLGFRHTKSITPAPPSEAKEFVEGNSALARGLVAAGLNAYLAYPMTPATSILHFLAKKQDEYGIKVIQPENEISVINMALGMGYGGKRVAIGTATGGFALMQEAFSLAGMTEIPIVVAVSQRYAPATGAPTHSSQADLRFVLHAGHGEFPRIVMAPGDPEEAFQCGMDALNLAWKYQLPVIVLLDKHVSENSMTSTLPSNGTIERGRLVDRVEGDYRRYAITDDGVSPLAFPGTPNAIIKVSSYEHDEEGIATEVMDTIKAMQDKRFAKSPYLARECADHDSVKVYGDAGSSNVVVFWGSTKATILEAAKHLEKPAKLVQIVWLEPFPYERVAQELSGARAIVDVEGNRGGQLAGLIREKTGIDIQKKILHYDSRPFDPLELAAELNTYFA
ncbi:MAG: hypothetical protein RL681_714 [Candidatus Parcubacteria bacterium]|jgi:2-oxoglutarate ferredoxin oxidoreductase subunit alpha